MWATRSWASWMMPLGPERRASAHDPVLPAHIVEVCLCVALGGQGERKGASTRCTRVFQNASEGLTASKRTGLVLGVYDAANIGDPWLSLCRHHATECCAGGISKEASNYVLNGRNLPLRERIRDRLLLLRQACAGTKHQNADNHDSLHVLPQKGRRTTWHPSRKSLLVVVKASQYFDVYRMNYEPGFRDRLWRVRNLWLTWPMAKFLRWELILAADKPF